MRYDYSMTVPANTLLDSPVTAEVNLTSGRLVKAEIQFQSGCHNFVFATVSSGLFQLAPANGCQPIFGDNQIQAVPLDFDLDIAGHLLILKGWSPGTRYQHIITFYLYVDQDDNLARDEYLALTQSLQQVHP